MSRADSITGPDVDTRTYYVRWHGLLLRKRYDERIEVLIIEDRADYDEWHPGIKPADVVETCEAAMDEYMDSFGKTGYR
jgi:hypothetical protein